jgi:hypothetical protein
MKAKKLTDAEFLELLNQAVEASHRAAARTEAFVLRVLSRSRQSAPVRESPQHHSDVATSAPTD